jgi:CBS domain-containing protein
MTPNAMTVKPDLPLRDVAQLLLGSGFGGVPVVDARGALVGVLSDLDLARALLTSGLDGHVRAAMTEGATSVDEFATTDDVIKVLRDHNLRHLPVVRQGAVVGVITPMDVIKYFLGTGEDVA